MKRSSAVALTMCALAACGGTADTTTEPPDAGPDVDAAIATGCPPAPTPDVGCSEYDLTCTYPVRSGEYVGCLCTGTPNDPGPTWECSEVPCPSFVPAGGSGCSTYLVGAECPAVGDGTCVFEYPHGPRWQCPGG